MNQYEGLFTILEKQFQIYSTLLDLENEKTKILMNRDITALDNLVNREQPCIMRSSNLENKRQKLQDEMNLGDLTLRQIIENRAEAAFLKDSFEKLCAIIIDLKRVTAANHKILNTKLDIIHYVLTESGVGTETGVYTNPK